MDEVDWFSPARDSVRRTAKNFDQGHADSPRYGAMSLTCLSEGIRRPISIGMEPQAIRELFEAYLSFWQATTDKDSPPPALNAILGGKA